MPHWEIQLQEKLAYEAYMDRREDEYKAEVRSGDAEGMCFDDWLANAELPQDPPDDPCDAIAARLGDTGSGYRCSSCDDGHILNK